MPFPEKLGLEGLLRVRVTHLEGRVEVFLSGELDLAGTDELEERVVVLASLTRGDVVLDLGELRFLGSAGVASLLGLHRELDAHGCRLVLRNVHGLARRVLELTGAAEVLNRE